MWAVSAATDLDKMAGVTDDALGCDEVALVLGRMAWRAGRDIVWHVASIASPVLVYAVAHTASDDPVVARGLVMRVIYAAVTGGIFFAAWMMQATSRRLKFEACDREDPRPRSGATVRRLRRRTS